MRRADEERFRMPYGGDVSSEAEWTSAIGVTIPSVRRLAQEILSDLDPDVLGVRWWAEHLPMAPRILIADHLFLCVNSIDTNLVEAKVHLLEALGVAEEQERRFAGAVTINSSGTPRFKSPKALSPADDLIAVRLNLHIVGCVRAIASALDCLGAAVIGVLALPAPIFKASYKAARAQAEQTQPGGHEVQRANCQRFLELIDSAGPQGWDEWVTEFRNMLVHRGRRMSSQKIVPAGSLLHAPRGGAVLSLNIVPMLPSDPGRSEIEVLRDASAKHLVLTENGWHTLESALGSASFLLENTAALLMDAWAQRRANPAALRQPAAQWPEPKTLRSAFVGYAPDTEPFDATEIHAHPSFAARIKAAAVDDASRARWRSE